MNRLVTASLAALLSLGFAGSALADRDHDRRHDRGRYDRDHRDHRHDRDHRDHRDQRHWRDHREWRREARPRHYHYVPPRYDYRWRAPAPRGWHPGWRERYGRGYRVWSDDYYYVVPAPGLQLNFVLPLR